MTDAVKMLKNEIEFWQGEAGRIGALLKTLALAVESGDADARTIAGDYLHGTAANSARMSFGDGPEILLSGWVTKMLARTLCEHLAEVGAKNNCT